jgi:hypothetical protein
MPRSLHSPTAGIGTELLAHREKVELMRHHSIPETFFGADARGASPHTRAIRRVERISPGDRDWLAEREGFEPSVRPPLFELELPSAAGGGASPAFPLNISR